MNWKRLTLLVTIFLPFIGGSSMPVLPSGVTEQPRSFFVPVTHSDYINVTLINNWEYLTGKGVLAPDDYSANFYGSFVIPADYKSGMQVKLCAIVNGSGNVYVENFAYYRAADADYNEHSDTFGPEAVAISAAYVLKELGGVSLTNAAAGDVVSVQFSRYGDNGADTFSGNFYVIGWWVTYTAGY